MSSCGPPNPPSPHCFQNYFLLHTHMHTHKHPLAGDLDSPLNSSEKRPSNSDILEFFKELVIHSLTTL